MYCAEVFAQLIIILLVKNKNCELLSQLATICIINCTNLAIIIIFKKFRLQWSSSLGQKASLTNSIGLQSFTFLDEECGNNILYFYQGSDGWSARRSSRSPSQTTSTQRRRWEAETQTRQSGKPSKKLWISRRHPSVQYSSGFTICSWLNCFDVEWAPECWMVRGSRSVWTEHWLARISSPSSPQRENPSMHINEEEKRNYKISSKWILYLICNVIFNSAVWFNYFSFAFHL